jgi:hypothetical protein
MEESRQVQNSGRCSYTECRNRARVKALGGVWKTIASFAD